MLKQRRSHLKRITKETQIEIQLNLDGTGKSRIKTGIAFLDHMLETLAKHGLFDIAMSVKGDLKVDTHHTNEDAGIALGEAFKSALEDKLGIRRFGDYRAPLDEALSGVRISLDLSGRGGFYMHTTAKTRWMEDPVLSNSRNKKGYTPFDARHFLESFAKSSGTTLHVDFISGEDFHHAIEAAFKSLAKALRQAVEIDPRVHGVPSTKGTL